MNCGAIRQSIVQQQIQHANVLEITRDNTDYSTALIWRRETTCTTLCPRPSLRAVSRKSLRPIACSRRHSCTRQRRLLNQGCRIRTMSARSGRLRMASTSSDKLHPTSNRNAGVHPMVFAATLIWRPNVSQRNHEVLVDAQVRRRLPGNSDMPL